VITIAAAADLHYGPDTAGALDIQFRQLESSAEILLLAGDLTKVGHPAEAKVLAEEVSHLEIPVVAVLGNHDYHQDSQDSIRQILEQSKVQVLEGEAISVTAGDVTVAIAGAKGFCGGFSGASGAEFGEPEMKMFIHHTRMCAEQLEASLQSVDGDLKIALLHYSPVEETLKGERLEIYPFLGSYLLAEAIDRAGADVVFHGHAHAGAERGQTPGGIPVRNVAQSVIGHAYGLYRFDRGGLSTEEHLHAGG
jgi:Icc-related predicted phosphoesterase